MNNGRALKGHCRILAMKGSVPAVHRPPSGGNVAPFPIPIPAKGALGLWEWVR